MASIGCHTASAKPSVRSSCWIKTTPGTLQIPDGLAPLAVLDGLREGVEIIDVSKIPRGRFTPQEEINDILVSRARQGRVVVRLKGGDSFVFGRGMEEVIACEEAGVPVQVIPGVSSATAAPELAGIPLTHRGISQGFTVVSGHAAPGDPRGTLDWQALARGGTTLVILMGAATLVSIVGALVDAGRDRIHRWPASWTGVCPASESS